MGYVAFNLTKESRLALLRAVPPRYEIAVCHHITVQFGVARRTAAVPPVPRWVQVVARVDDGTGVEALVVHVDGDWRRADGGVYHVTHSLAPGRKAVESNAALENKPWSPLPQVLRLQVVPAWNE